VLSCFFLSASSLLLQAGYAAEAFADVWHGNEVTGAIYNFFALVVKKNFLRRW
jgi:hypothetical protein